MPPSMKPYQALTNLSIGRTARDRTGEKLADIVHKGETVHLTDEQARGFMTRHRVPVIRPVDEQDEPAPVIGARQLFGERAPAQAFQARPDPAGASQVRINPEAPADGSDAAESADPADPRNAPEANDPQTDLTVDPDAARDK